MLARVKHVLARLRPATAPPPDERPEAPWPTFADEIAAGGATVPGWLQARRTTRALYVDIDDARVRAVAERHPETAAAALAAADRALRHEFNLLGSGAFTPYDENRAPKGSYKPIDWQVDPIRALRFPTGFPHRRWNAETMRPGNADIKLPWELGRCQHFFALGQAFRLTSSDVYAREIADEIADFVEANPTGTGVQWVCTMDVALRAISWAIGLALVARTAGVRDEEWIAGYQALFDHGIFIERNLENTFEVTSNHFLTNVLGLQVLGAIFADLPSGRRWCEAARGWLEQEMQVQVLADGADYESSIPYHRLVTELFLGGARLAALENRPLSDDYLARLARMIDFLAAVQRPDGLMPVVGDADDGRLHIATWGSDAQDPRHLLAAGGVFFGRGDWIAAAGPAAEWEAAWWGLDVDVAQPGSVEPRPASRHFPDAGITVLRDDRAYVLITNGRVGTNGFGNHKHNDQLSFEYHVDGQPLVVDPGSYVYTPDPAARNLFRGTRYHNTLVVDGVEQNELRPEWLFRLFEQAHAEHLHVETGERLEYLGRHSGYRRLPAPVAHERRFVLSAGTLEISDRLAGSKRHALAWHFHFDPRVEIETAAAHSEAWVIHAGTIAVTLTPPAGLDGRAGDGWYSPSYGVRHRCRVLDFHGLVDVESRREFVFTFAIR